jgi:hypothetical protein
VRYAIRIWYAATANGDEPQAHIGLTGAEAETAAGAFLNDLFALDGRGVRRVTVEVDDSEADEGDPGSQTRVWRRPATEYDLHVAESFRRDFGAVGDLVCRKDDVYVGFRGPQVAAIRRPEGKSDEWLADHCWLCGASADEVREANRVRRGG